MLLLHRKFALEKTIRCISAAETDFMKMAKLKQQLKRFNYAFIIV